MAVAGESKDGMVVAVVGAVVAVVVAMMALSWQAVVAVVAALASAMLRAAPDAAVAVHIDVDVGEAAAVVEEGENQIPTLTAHELRPPYPCPFPFPSLALVLDSART